MKQKWICIISVLFVLCGLLGACDKNKPYADVYDRYKMAPLPDSAYALKPDTAAVCVYDNKVYAAKETIGYYDLQNNMEYHELWRIPMENGAWEAEVSRVDIETERMIFLNKAPCIMACDNGVWYAYQTSVYHISDDGDLLDTYPLEIPENGCFKNIQILANDRYTYVFYSYSLQAEDSVVYTTKYMVLDAEDGIVESGTLYSANEELKEIYSVQSTKKNNVSILAQYTTKKKTNTGTRKQSGVFTLDIKTGEIALVTEINTPNTTFIGFTDTGTLFGIQNIDSGRFYGEKKDDKEFQSKRSLLTKTIYDMVCSALQDLEIEPDAMGGSYIAYTGNNVVIWDYNNCVITFIDLEPKYERELTILAPMSGDGIKGYINRDSVLLQMMFEEENDVAIRTQSIDASLFNEKLRIKMLAADDDYDIVLLEDTPELLPSILRYSLYLPLENHEKIQNGFAKFIDGIENVVTYDDHIFGVPYVIDGSIYGLTTAYLESKLTIPEESYSLEQFWAICDGAKTSGTKLADDRQFFGIMMTGIIENGQENGNLTAEAVRIQLEKFLEYNSEKVLNHNDNLSPLLCRMPLTCLYGEDKSEADLKGTQTFIPVPAIGGKNYYTIESMIFVSSNTQNPDLSKEYIAYMLENDYPAMLSLSSKLRRSLLYKDPSSYCYAESGRYRNGYDTEYTRIELNDYELFYLGQSAPAFKNAAPAIYTTELGDFFRTVLQEIYDGVLTPKMAAEKIVSEVKYRFEE